MEPHLLLPYLDSKVSLDLFEDKAWVSLGASLTNVHFRLLGNDVSNSHTKELQTICYVIFGDKKGIMPLEIEFESKVLTKFTQMEEYFPFGCHTAVMETDFKKEESFQFTCKREEFEFPLHSTKGRALEETGLTQFLMDPLRKYMVSVKNHQLETHFMPDIHMSAPFEAKLSAFNSNYLKLFQLGDCETGLDLEGMREGQCLWIDQRVGDIRLKTKQNVT